MEYPFLSLEECAKRSGFSSCQYFYKVFKAHFGVTPAKYKKQRGK
jgi:AraC family transcriptional regulator of arabinose operon